MISWLRYVWVLGVLVCCDQARRTDFHLSDKALIPEGTAYYPEKDMLFIGSIHRQKVIGLMKNGNESTVIAQDQFGKFSPLGMTYDSHSKKLWVCAAMAPIVHRDPVEVWETGVMSFDPKTGERIRRYQSIKSPTPILLNDLTVTREGKVFITESIGNRIYTIDPKTDSLQLFHEFTRYSFPNGITHWSDNLFVATDQGIVRLNIGSRESSLLKTSKDVDATVIDGLEINNDHFIGHQSSKVTRFYFEEQITTLYKAEPLDSGAAFDSSTTGEVIGEEYWFIVNSQIRSGIDQRSKSVKPLDSLESIIIRRIAL